MGRAGEVVPCICASIRPHLTRLCCSSSAAQVGRAQQDAAQRLANEVRPPPPFAAHALPASPTTDALSQVKAKIKTDIANGDFRDAREEDDDDDYGPRGGGVDGGRAGRLDAGSRKRKNPRGITGLGTMGGFGGGGGGGDMDIDG